MLVLDNNTIKQYQRERLLFFIFFSGQFGRFIRFLTHQHQFRFRQQQRQQWEPMQTYIHEYSNLLFIINEPGEQSTRAHRFVLYVCMIFKNQSNHHLWTSWTTSSAAIRASPATSQCSGIGRQKRRRSDRFNGPSSQSF